MLGRSLSRGSYMEALLLFFTKIINLQPWAQGFKNSFYTHFSLPHPGAMLTKHFMQRKLRYTFYYFPTMKAGMGLLKFIDR